MTFFGIKFQQIKKKKDDFFQKEVKLTNSQYFNIILVMLLFLIMRERINLLGELMR